jgi:hypothetical protein
MMRDRSRASIDRARRASRCARVASERDAREGTGVVLHWWRQNAATHGFVAAPPRTRRRRDARAHDGERSHALSRIIFNRARTGTFRR